MNGVARIAAALMVWAGFAPSASADLQVAALHPLMADLAENVGGAHVQVVSLMRAGGDPHGYAPSPGDLARIREARLILASGKGLEGFLGRLAANLQPGQEIFEVGKKVPSLRIEAGELFVCCPAHSEGTLDSHWWHSIANMQRAARYLADEFARVDPAHTDDYQRNAANYRARLGELKAWADRELAAIPRARRVLTTAHAAFGYFCKEFRFRAIPVQGLDRESDPSPSYLATTIEALKSNQVQVVFPEKGSNPRVLEAMVRETGVQLGPRLIADGTGSGAEATYEGMMRHNVSAIVRALAE